MAVKFKDTININGEYTFPNTDGSVGQAIVTDGTGNLSFGSVAAGTADAALKITLTVKNVSGGTLNAGTLVRVAPTANPPSGNVLEVDVADNSSVSTMPAVGILISQITDESEGNAVAFGRASGFSTSGYTEGDPIWVGSNGAFVGTKPTGSDLIQKIGQIIKVHNSNGSIEVFGAGRTNDVPNLPSGKIWVGDNNTTVSTIVHLDELNGRVGIGTDSPDFTLDISNSTFGNQLRLHRSSVASGGFLTLSANDSVGNKQDYAKIGAIVESATSGSEDGALVFQTSLNAILTERMRITSGGDISFRDTSTNEAFYWDASTASLGIGTTSPGNKLHLSGANPPSADIALGDAYGQFGIYNEGNQYGIQQFVTGTGDGHIQVGRIDGSATSYDLILQELGGNVGIGTDSPAVSLDISGTDAIQVPKGLTSDRPTPASGMFRFNTTTNEFEGYNGTEWAPIGGANAASIDVDSFTGDAVETAFTLSSAISEEVATQIYIDGVYQSKDNYSTSGTTLTFTDAPADGASVEVVHFTGISESDLNGSGTINYISKWLDTDTLTNSIIYDNGTNVGIGAGSSPSAKLHVKTTNTTAEDVAHFGNNNIANGLAVTTNGNLDWGFNARNTRNLTFSTNQTERMRIDSSGVISTKKSSGGGSMLDLRGGTYSDIQYAGGLSISSNPSNNYNRYWNIDASFGLSIGRYVTSTDALDFNALTISSSGNVGIGTTSPYTKLTINSGIARISTAKTYSTFVHTNDPDDFRVGLATAIKGGATSADRYVSLEAANYQVSTNTFTGGIDLALNPLGGNIGIGTDSPKGRLHVLDGAAGTYTPSSESDTLVVESATPGGISLIGTGAGALSKQSIVFGTTGDVTGASIVYDGNNSFLSIGTTTPSLYLRFTSGDNVERMRIASNGTLTVGGQSSTRLVTTLTENDKVDLNAVDGTSTARNLTFSTGNTEHMRITSGSDVGIGATSPKRKLHVVGNFAVNAGTGEYYGVNITGGESADPNILIGDWHNSSANIGWNSADNYLRIDAQHNDSGAPIVFSGNDSAIEYMRITSAGDVEVTGGYVSSQAFQSTGALRVSSNSTTNTSNVALELLNDATGTRYLASFSNLNGVVGSISTLGSATSYNTSSDYRLKENVVPMEGALDRVDALKPSRFNFIADADKTVDGFLAHEVAEVVPEAISGEKDAVDEEGNAIYQGIDQSKLVPLLVGAIQELKAEIETLKSQINN